MGVARKAVPNARYARVDLLSRLSGLEGVDGGVRGATSVGGDSAALSVEARMQQLHELNVSLQNELDEVLDFETRLERQRQQHL